MILIYLVFFFLILRFTVTVFNFISNPKLTASPKNYQDLVSVLIPCRNEERNILTLLESLKSQDYQQIEVIILDDNSTDSTFQLCEIYCMSDPRFNVIEGKTLEPGWLGKNFACDQLAERATGEFMIFLDADEEVMPGLINNAVHRMRSGKLQLLSLFTDQRMLSWGERMVVPLMHYILLNLLPLRFVSIFRHPAFSAASGQFMMFNSESYRQYRWHEMVKAEVVEDIAIMKHLKAFALRAETLLANGYLYCRMYRSLGEAVRGFTKNILAGFNHSIPALCLFLMLIILAPLIVAPVLSPDLILFGVSLILLSRVMISLLSRQNVLHNLVLHPVQLALFFFIAILSIQKHLTGQIFWKGRRIDTR